MALDPISGVRLRLVFGGSIICIITIISGSVVDNN